MDTVFTILKGFSLVFFQNNIILGALIVLGLLIASPITLLLALIGNVTSIIVGNKLFNTPKAMNDIQQYGFNGVLIGAAIAFYIKNISLGVALTIIASILAVFIFHQLFKSQIPPLAAPFLIVIWMLLVLLKIKL